MNKFINVYQRLSVFIGVCAALNVCAAQTWIDVTDTYIQNARFDDNSGEGWEGDAWGFAGPMQNAEHYSMTFDTYQSLTGLAKGKYRLSMKGYYRAGSSSDDWNHWKNDGDSYRYAQLYATSSVSDYYTPIVYCSSAALSQGLGGATSQVGDGGWWGGGDVKYIPNNMEAAYYWFQAGYYDNMVEDIEVGSDGELRIGTRKTTYVGSDWMCVDDFKLEYYGTLVSVTSVTMSQTKLTMALGETGQLTATVLPENATYRKLTWESSNSDIVSVDDDGNIFAQGEGNAVVTASSTDGSGKYATCNITVKNSGGDKKSIVINEIMAANIDEFMDPTYNYGGFIEIYNPTDNPASLANYYISDDPENLLKWHMPVDIGAAPSHGYMTIWFDHYGFYTKMTQVPFKLDADGGTIYISNSNGELIASQDYPAAIRRCSYARTQDGGDTWGWTATGTPGKTNNSCVFAAEQLETPTVNKEGQLISSAIQVVVNIPSGCTLRYTTDGSTPTLSNGYTSQTGTFSVSASAVYRFRFFKTGYLPSDVKTCSYIYKDKTFSGPIISIVTDNKHINGNDYGIFVIGNGKGRAGNGQSSKCNWNMDWDRPVSLEFFDEGSEEVSFCQEVNISPTGGWSRAWTPHSFKLKAEKKYGLNYLAYPVFPNKPYIKNKTLQVRNGGNDTSCRIKDAAIQGVIQTSGMDVDGQSYRPAYVYVNGKFYSTLNIREPNNKHFAYANKGYDTDEMDQFEYSPDSAYVQMEGTREAFERLLELSENAADPETYEEIKQFLDIDEFINYMACEMYLGSSDWLANSNNCKAYRPRVEGGKFRFVTFDLDAAFSTTNTFWDTHNNRYNKALNTLKGYYNGQTLYKDIEVSIMWVNLLQNEDFKKQFIDAFCLATYSVFEPSRCKEIVTELATKAATVMSSANTGSPWSTANSVISSLSASRQSTMINNMKSYMGISGTESITANIASNLDQAKLLINDQPVPTGKFSGTLFLPVTVTAQAPAGYRFKGWNGSGSAKMKTLFDYKTTWKYYDQGSLDNQSWKSKNYSTTSWGEGEAPLGYATGSTWKDPTTVLDYDDNGSKRPTFYFRKNVALTKAPSSTDEFRLTFFADDGIVVYVNGSEAGRWNMPSGTVSYSTYSSAYGDQYFNSESTPQTMSLSPSLFQRGTNVIAVEVHNCDNHSSDIHWNAMLEMTDDTGGEEGYLSTDSAYVLTGNVDITAIFEPLSDEEQKAAGSNPVMINEVSAGNSIYINDLFKKEDWVELYNTTDEAVDLEGMYLTDKLAKPQKFQFQSGDISTLIEPHGFRIIWCDKKDAVSQLHATFKLDNDDGAYVMLTAQDGSWADTLQYNAMEGDMSFGRYPDGGQNVYAMYNTTIEKSNTITSYDTLHIQMRPEPLPDGIRTESLIARDGGMSITYSGGYILVKNENCLPTTLMVYTPAGQMAGQAQFDMRSGHASYGTALLPEGIYIIRAKDSEGNSVAIRLVVR